uniref:Uncharacterized protein LOC114330681 isoform X1 n=1 Tax=Diabrotica virgifera virgifera TaxID=50390 RepID=A0A6P7FIY6_DIAVI
MKWSHIGLLSIAVLVNSAWSQGVENEALHGNSPSLNGTIDISSLDGMPDVDSSLIGSESFDRNRPITDGEITCAGVRILQHVEPECVQESGSRVGLRDCSSNRKLYISQSSPIVDYTDT